MSLADDARHYAIGRIKADRRTQEHLASEKNHALAVVLACQFAGEFHRVFLYQLSGDNKFAPYNCRKIHSTAGDA